MAREDTRDSFIYHLLAVLLLGAVILIALQGADYRRKIDELQARLEEAERQKVLVIESSERQLQLQEAKARNEKWTYGVGIPRFEKKQEPMRTTVYKGETMVLASPNETIGAEYVGTFTLTYYCTCTKCTDGDGIGASGRRVVPFYSIAVDPSVIPMGTVLYMDYYGDGSLMEVRADDTGGAIKGYKLDLCVGDHATAWNLGTRTVTLYRK